MARCDPVTPSSRPTLKVSRVRVGLAIAFTEDRETGVSIVKKIRVSTWMAVLLALVVGLSVAGCASRMGQGALIGGGAGALTGGLIGGEWGALAGSLLGAALGAGIGAELDRQDRLRAAYVLENAPTRSSQEWVNPDTGAWYRMTPVETYRGRAGQPCREFTLQGYIGGTPQEVYGTACRQPDGSWRLVDSAPS